MGWGCSIRDGWENLLRKTCKRLVECQEKNQVEIYFSQVKEKLGLLRIYYHSKDKLSDETSKEIKQIIDEAESESGELCEICGSKEEVTTSPRPGGFWSVTVCMACREKIKSEQPAKENANG